MKRIIINGLLVAMIGTTAVFGGFTTAGAETTAFSSHAIAGISASLDSYASANKDLDTTVESGLVPEEFKLNLVYDRLGIAQVDNYLNIRKKPDEEGKVVGKLTKNAGCNVYKIKDGWAKIISGGIKGWVKEEYLVTDADAEEYAKKVAKKVATVTTDTLKVRALPSTESKVYTLVPADEELVVVKEDLTQNYVERFYKKHKDDKDYLLEDSNAKLTYEDLKDWICVKIDSERAFVKKEFVDISYKLSRASKFSEKELAEAQMSSVRSQMVSYAYQFLGNRYVYGGTSLTNGTDCSGFTMRIYEHFGYGIPRTSSEQAAASSRISYDQVKPGDLFFYGHGSSVSHVAMYIGDGMVIHASNEATGIKVSNAYYRSPIKIGRFIYD
ncbi:MAG: C40 family peptidase [Lachnospiraceae bacterium]|nr:C40 family peptidase [Lachnospiraceae bacterium]